MPTLAWGVAIRIAWRELRAARARFLFVILAVAVGVGAVTGVRGFSRSFRNMLMREARTLMAGDLTTRMFSMPTAEQTAALDALESRGVRRTWITETVTMAASAKVADPLLVSVKAVDPRFYPFYGEVKLDPPGRLRDVLDAQSVVASDDLLLRLDAHPGDTLRLGGQDFRIAARTVAEPDRMTGSLNVGPRVMISRPGLDRTGLIGTGSRASERFLFRLPATGSPGVAQVRSELRAILPEAMVTDYTETHPIITRGLDRATTFLSLIGLIALVIGAMGVGSAMHGHLRQKLDSIAVMKCIGARSSQVIRIYVSQTLMLGLSGGVLGALVGLAVTAAFPALIARYFTISVARYWDPWPAIEGIAVACLITLLFTLPPLVSIREIKPAEVFRRDVSASTRRRAGILPHLIRAAILLGTGAIAGALTEGPLQMALRTGAWFAVSLAVALGLLTLAAWLFLGSVRRVLARAGRRLPGVVRYGIANLHRPGNQAQAAVIALGVGVMFTVSVFLIERALVGQIRGSAPPGMPNVFMLDIPGPERAALADLVRRQAGVEAAPEVATAVVARLTAVNGTPVEQLPLGNWGRRFSRTRSVTELAARPPDTEILSGAWWSPQQTEALVCVSEETARVLNLRPGDVIDWNIWNKHLSTRVACTERTESVRMAGRFEFIFNPGHLEGFPAVYYGSARVRPANVPALQREVFRRFPTVAVVNVADVMEIVRDVVDRIAAVIRFISAFTILAGAVMVGSSVAGTRFRRMREVVILKTLGATRRRIAWIFSVEFLALGTLAGLMGTALASAFSMLVLRRLLDIYYRPSPGVIVASILLAALAATGAGWAASFRILGRKPLEILREE